MSKYYGKQISPILAEIAEGMWEIDARELQQPYEYAETALADATKIFMSVAMDKFWANAEAEGWTMEQRSERVQALGDGLRAFIKEHLGVDSHEFYTKAEL